MPTLALSTRPVATALSLSPAVPIPIRSMNYAASAHAGTTYAPPTRAVAVHPLDTTPFAVRPSTRPAGAYRDQAARYRDAELASATPGQLVVLLFDKCVLTIRRAHSALDAGDIAARTAHICVAADMIAELRGSLDFEVGGDMSRQLDALYAYALRELFAANRTQDSAKLASVLHVVSELRDGFAGAVAQIAAAQAAAPQLRSA